MEGRGPISVCLIFCLISLPLSVIVRIPAAGSMEENGSGSIPSRSDPEPILIESDSDLLNEALERGWNGSGSGNDPFIISDLYFRDCGTVPSVIIRNTTSRLVIKDCYFGNRTRTGGPLDVSSTVVLENVRDAVITHSRFINCSRGLFILECESIEVRSVVFSEFSEFRIHVDDSRNISVMNCSMTDTGNGIYLRASESCSIEDNKFVDLYYGLVLWESNGSRICSNLFLRSIQFAVQLISSHANNILNNSFCYNRLSNDRYESSSRQASDDTGNNTWSSITGNHWRDLTGPDDNKDGIVDRNYTLCLKKASDRSPMVYSPLKTVTTPPRNLEIERQEEGVWIEWDPPSDTGRASWWEYLIYRMKEGENWELIEAVDMHRNRSIDHMVEHGNDYLYRIKARNPNGMSNPSETMYIYWDEMPPVFTRISPSNGSFVTQSAFRATWEAEDDGYQDPCFEVVLDGGESIDAGNDNDHYFRDVKEGNHTMTVFARDQVGNTAVASTTFTVDSVAPVIQFDHPVDGQYLDHGISVIDFEVLEETSGIADCMISVDNGNFFIYDPGDSNRTHRFEEGDHTIVCRVRDKAGNQRMNGIEFTVDLTPPELDILLPKNGLLTSSRNVLLRWEAFDGSGLTSLSMKLDGRGWTGVMGKSEIGFMDLSHGDHEVTLKAEDPAGHMTVRRVSFTIDIRPPEVIERGYLPGYGNETGTIWFRFDEEVDEGSIRATIFGIDVEARSVLNGSYRLRVPDEIEEGRRVTVSITASDLMNNTMERLNFDIRMVSDEELDTGILTGRILDEGGRPVFNAYVNITGGGRTRTSLEGTYSMVLIRGNHTAIISADGFLSVDVKFSIEPGETTVIDDISLSRPTGVPTENEGGSDRTWMVAGIALFIIILIVLFMMMVRRTRKDRSGREKERNDRDNEEEERNRLYSAVPIPRDLAEAFASQPSLEDEEAILRMLSPEDMMDIDGEIVKEDRNAYWVQDFETEEVRGLDLSFLDDEVEEMDWKELANPLYDTDPEDEISFEDMDCYMKLGVGKDATREEIRKAYRRLAALYHPDRISRFDKVLRDRAIEEMKRINFAKEVLLHEELRQEHDERLLGSARIEF